jgi:hypothetical protein
MNKSKSILGVSLAAALSLVAVILAAQPSINSANAVAQVQISPIETESLGKLNVIPVQAEPIEVAAAAEDLVTADIIEDRVSKAEIDVSLAPIPIPLPGGLDHAAAGAGTRNAGFGTIRLRGVPAGSRVVSAFLYWGDIGVAPGLNACFNGNVIPPARIQLVGSSRQPCWNPAGTFFAYRTDVRHLLSPGVNGDYLVRCLRTSVANGTCPWTPPVTALPLSEGATLLVIYSHPSVPRTAQVILSHGPQFFALGNNDYTTLLTLPIPPHTTVKHTRFGADGQVGVANCGLSSILSITDERTSLGPSPFALTQIKGPGSPFNGDSDWNGNDGQPQNKLWDTQTDVAPGGIIPAGVTQYTVRHTARGDCIVWVGHVLGVR